MKWTYSPYRASLYRSGEFFAIITPDGSNALEASKAMVLLDQLNACPETVDSIHSEAKDRIAELTGSLAGSVGELVVTSAKLRETRAKLHEAECALRDLRQKREEIRASVDFLLQETEQMRDELRRLARHEGGDK